MIPTRVLLVAAALSLSCGYSYAQQASPTAWPSKPVKIMVGASPGGGTDIIARMLADKFQAAFGQVFVVENRPGAGNTIAADVTARAVPDGHTLLVATNSAQAIAPHMMKLAFDPMKDLVPVALIVVVPNIVAVAPTVKASNIRELVAEIRAAPEGSYSCGSSGVGSTQHLACEAFGLATRTKITHIPYKGSAPALTDLAGGQIQLDFDTTSSAMAFIKGGKAKALAVMTSKRSPEMPDVPTLAEAGIEGVEMSTWYGLFATAVFSPDGAHILTSGWWYVYVWNAKTGQIEQSFSTSASSESAAFSPDGMRAWAAVGSTIKVWELDPEAGRLANVINGIENLSGINIIDIYAQRSLVPQCAMQVSRTADGGDIQPFTPDTPCGCYYESLASHVGTPPGCTSCDRIEDCGAGQACVMFAMETHGFCE